MRPMPPAEREEAIASDVEQAHGRAGNSRDSEEVPDQRPRPEEVLGSSGFVPQAEIAKAITERDNVASPGAQADQEAARHGN